MLTLVYWVLIALFLAANVALFINAIPDPRIDWWDVDGDSELPPPSKLDLLRGRVALCVISAVWLGSYFALRFLERL